MNYQKSKQTNLMKLPAALLYGWVIGMISTIIMGVAVTGMVNKNVMSISALSVAAVITIIVSGFLSSVVSGARAGERRLLTCMCTGAMYFVTLICGNALFFDGKFNGLVGGALCIMGTSFAACLIKLNRTPLKIRYHRNQHNTKMYKMHK